MRLTHTRLVERRRQLFSPYPGLRSLSVFTEESLSNGYARRFLNFVSSQVDSLCDKVMGGGSQIPSTPSSSYRFSVLSQAT